MAFFRQNFNFGKSKIFDKLLVNHCIIKKLEGINYKVY